jgi:hypothetical protein
MMRKKVKLLSLVVVQRFEAKCRGLSPKAKLHTVPKRGIFLTVELAPVAVVSHQPLAINQGAKQGPNTL